jgi:hypothetical protein
MRHLLFAALAVALGSGSARPQFAQGTRIEITADTGGSAAVWASRSEIYLDAPAAGVGAPSTAGVGGPPAAGDESLPPLMFIVRSWKEADNARVVVYARLKDPRAPTGATETPIATFVMAPGDTRAVPEAEKWGGPRITIRATRQ